MIPLPEKFTSSEYITSLEFSYMEIYSFQRGEGALINGMSLMDAKGNFHPTAVKTHTFKKSDEEARYIVDILKTEAVNVFYWMCGILFRDGIVFYNENGKIVSVLNICFLCGFMQMNRTVTIDADDKVYTLLRAFFLEKLGHKIEDR